MVVEENGDEDDLDDIQEGEDHLDNQMAVPVVLVVPHEVDTLPHVLHVDHPVVLLHMDYVEGDKHHRMEVEEDLLRTIQDEVHQ